MGGRVRANATVAFTQRCSASPFQAVRVDEDHCPLAGMLVWSKLMVR